MGRNCTLSFRLCPIVLCLLFYKIPNGSAYTYVTEFFEVPVSILSGRPT